jgi:hypothetical protein
LNNRTTARFRQSLSGLPDDVQRHARRAFRLFSSNPDHPSLRFKQVHTTEPVFSARVSLHYRALAARDGDTLIWFWIGTHADYDQLLRSL